MSIEQIPAIETNVKLFPLWRSMAKGTHGARGKRIGNQYVLEHTVRLVRSLSTNKATRHSPSTHMRTSSFRDWYKKQQKTNLQCNDHTYLDTDSKHPSSNLCAYLIIYWHDNQYRPLLRTLLGRQDDIGGLDPISIPWLQPPLVSAAPQLPALLLITV